MIGVFDSGMGGLTIVKYIFELLPEYQVLYFGDTARTPYGTRSKETIQRYAFEDTAFLKEKGAKLVIIACNTASAIAWQTLKKKFNFPIFEVVTPAVKQAINYTKNKRIGVIGTRATIESKIYEKLIRKQDRKIKVFSRACPLLIPLIEEGWAGKPETKRIIKKYLYSLKLAKIDTLILACTHFPLVKDIIQAKIGKSVRLVDPGIDSVLQVKNFLETNPKIEKMITKGGKHQFFVSDLTAKFQAMAKQWLGQPIKLKKINIRKYLTYNL